MWRLFLILVACHAATPRPTDPLVIETDRGPIRGVATKLGREFLGVPFATAQRFAPPEPVAAWKDTFDATKRRAACLQLDGDETYPGSSEDCLNLEVWVPPDADHAPVMLWIPGGAFVQGAGNFALYDGARLAAREHVVVVAINYRVAAFGFGSFPFAKLPSLGLLDQRAAMEWVQRNIARFGGDPGNVTIFGESAGAWSVCAHLAMAKSQGLFAKAIMESGSCSDPLYFTADQAAAQGAELAAKLGCTDLACMRAKTGEEIMRALPQRRAYILAPGTWYGPVVDGVELTAQPLEMLRARPSSVPLIVGWNRDEGTLHVVRIPDVTAEQVATFVREAFGERALAILADYAAPTPKDQLDGIIRDGAFACAARRLARTMKGPVYQYEFMHPLDDPRPHDLGATHSVELWFVFGTEDGGIGLSAAERPLSDRVQDLWGTFARTADPGHDWPRYAGTDKLQLIDMTPGIADHVKHDICDRWDSLVR